MANKFQKSVLERLEQETARQNQRPKETIEMGKNTAENPTKRNANKTECPPLLEKKRGVLREKGEMSPRHAHRDSDISGYLVRNPQRFAKNKTFYLDGDVIDAIRSTAQSQSVTDSKLVNDILRHVLGL